MVVGKYELEVKDIEFPGIPQGSPLSPLLYIWYNADLVDRKIDNKISFELMIYINSLLIFPLPAYRSTCPSA